MCTTAASMHPSNALMLQEKNTHFRQAIFLQNACIENHRSLPCSSSSSSLPRQSKFVMVWEVHFLWFSISCTIEEERRPFGPTFFAWWSWDPWELFKFLFDKIYFATREFGEIWCRIKNDIASLFVYADNFQRKERNQQFQHCQDMSKTC